MKKVNRILWFSMLLALLLLGFSACGGGSGSETESDTGANAEATTEADASADATETEDVAGVELNISAAASLTDALEEIYTEYQKESNDVINFNFAASGTLQKQILEGAPCDLFMSASKGHMDGLADANLIVPESRKDLLGNALTLIADAALRNAVLMDTVLPTDPVEMGKVAEVAVYKHATAFYDQKATSVGYCRVSGDGVQ
jgi:molybdate transport system substrate-binding protein